MLPALLYNNTVSRSVLPCWQELKKKLFEQQRKQAAKDIRLSAYTAEADLNVSRILADRAFSSLTGAT